VDKVAQGPALLLEESERALSDLKSGKAPGVDKIPTEFLKAHGTNGKTELPEIYNKIYIQREWP